MAAITGGFDDDGDLGVVGLVRDNSIYCTGTLVGDRAIVTAAHCLTPAPEWIFFGAALDLAGRTVPIADVRAHPDYDVSTFGSDIGLVLLAEPAPDTATPWLLGTPQLNAAQVGRSIRVVGFGSTLVLGQTSGRKRQGTTLIAEIDAASFRYYAEPHQTCMGDSGGPAFVTIDDVEHLVGVTSSGDPSCTDFGVSIRVDAFMDGFIAPYLGLTSEGAAQMAERCFYDGNCATGFCVEAPDPPAFPYCSLQCTSSSECPDAMTCTLDVFGVRACRLPLPSPGALGTSCGDDLSCGTGVCARESPEGERVCSVRCFPENEIACPDDYRCATNADDTNRSACFPRATSGCSATNSGANEWWWMSIAIVLALRRSRRPRKIRASDWTGRCYSWRG